MPSWAYICRTKRNASTSMSLWGGGVETVYVLRFCRWRLLSVKSLLVSRQCVNGIRQGKTVLHICHHESLPLSGTSGLIGRVNGACSWRFPGLRPKENAIILEWNVALAPTRVGG